MTNFDYFKKAFIPAVVLISIYSIVNTLLNADFNNLPLLGKDITKKMFASIITAVVLGILNIYVKKDSLYKKN